VLTDPTGRGSAKFSMSAIALMMTVRFVCFRFSLN
jgi:hypothetical protein